jgi:hypothetical protein
MRKRVIERVGIAAEGGRAAVAWMDLDAVAEVEISSEEELFPIERALGTVGGSGSTGWRASEMGPQTIRLRFDTPVAIHRISLHFVERAVERSQEFVVHVGETAEVMQEVVRQQFSFSPGGATEEFEDYAVELPEVTVFELRIDPDRAHEPKLSQAYASLVSLRLA